jgi:hypothetical protein
MSEADHIDVMLDRIDAQANDAEKELAALKAEIAANPQ